MIKLMFWELQEDDEFSFDEKGEVHRVTIAAIAFTTFEDSNGNPMTINIDDGSAWLQDVFVEETK